VPREQFPFVQILENQTFNYEFPLYDFFPKRATEKFSICVTERSVLWGMEPGHYFLRKSVEFHFQSHDLRGLRPGCEHLIQQYMLGNDNVSRQLLMFITVVPG